MVVGSPQNVKARSTTQIAPPQTGAPRSSAFRIPVDSKRDLQARIFPTADRMADPSGAGGHFSVEIRQAPREDAAAAAPSEPTILSFNRDPEINPAVSRPSIAARDTFAALYLLFGAINREARSLIVEAAKEQKLMGATANV